MIVIVGYGNFDLEIANRVLKKKISSDRASSPLLCFSEKSSGSLILPTLKLKFIPFSKQQYLISVKFKHYTFQHNLKLNMIPYHFFLWERKEY